MLQWFLAIYCKLYLILVIHFLWGNVNMNVPVTLPSTNVQIRDTYTHLSGIHMNFNHKRYFVNIYYIQFIMDERILSIYAEGGVNVACRVAQVRKTIRPHLVNMAKINMYVKQTLSKLFQVVYYALLLLRN